MPVLLTREKGLNQQETFGKNIKKDKLYPNADFSNLCYMSDEEVRKDRKYYQEHTIHNYFTTDFKKQFKVYRHGEKLCFLRNQHYVPLPSGKYGFIVSPKGGLYAIFHPAGAANPMEIQNKEFFHSLFRAGQPVQSAGFFSYNAKSGQITDIYRDSGHYKPKFDQHLRACKGLVDAGILNFETRVGKFSDPPNPPSFALGDIINNLVDYSIIASDAAKTIYPPPPTDGYYAQKTSAQFKSNVEDHVTVSNENLDHHDRRFAAHLLPAIQGGEPQNFDHKQPMSPKIQTCADHVVIEIDNEVDCRFQPKRKGWLESFAGVINGLIPRAPDSQSVMKATLRAFKDSDAEKTAEEAQTKLGSSY